MLRTLKTIFVGVNARAEGRIREAYSVELIEQKIREASAGLKAAKATLAGLIQRQRAETRQIEVLDGRVDDLTKRAKEALKGAREDLAADAADAIAALENERNLRCETCNRLERRVLQLRQSVETVNTRIIDLKQGAVAARAVTQEQQMQVRLNSTLAGQSSISEAEELVAEVLSQDDPFEQSQILQEIDNGLSRADIAERMASEGFGPSEKSTGKAVLERLKANK